MNGGVRSGFRRTIRLAASHGRVEAEVLDDFHHFALALDHDGARVTEIRGEARRFPWTTCQAAPTALSAFAGVALAAHPLTVFPLVNPRSQCTHLFELAALAMAQASRGVGERLYAVKVDDPSDGEQGVRLTRDGGRLFDLSLVDDVVVRPVALEGRAMRALTGRMLAAMPPEEGEAWMIMRQAWRTARGRQMTLDGVLTPLDLGRAPACFTGLAENLPRARRVVGSQRDFSDGSKTP